MFRRSLNRGQAANTLSSAPNKACWRLSLTLLSGLLGSLLFVLFVLSDCMAILLFVGGPAYQPGAGVPRAVSAIALITSHSAELTL